uniref:Uncharacterized protein n=1 Tax=Solanum lycopersicum TaxID=4081 RepID=A0A3Q7JX99_SOLLC
MVNKYLLKDSSSINPANLADLVPGNTSLASHTSKSTKPPVRTYLLPNWPSLMALVFSN